MPAISIAIPISMSRWHNAVGTLRSITHQTVSMSDVEICLGIDGNNNDAAHKVLDIVQPTCGVRYDYVGGEASAVRRNAARNRACSLCTSPLMMINDADMMLPPHAISEILYAHRAMRAAGKHAATFQRLARIENDLSTWNTLSEPYMSGQMSMSELLNKANVTSRIFDAFAGVSEAELAGKPFVGIRSVKENFPTIESWLWRDLGGFDERFVGWGGNKQEFVERLKHLSHLGLISLLLLPRITLYHQPHAPAPDAFNKPLRKHNSALYRTIVSKHQHLNWAECERKIRRSISRLSDVEPEALGVTIISYMAPTEPYELTARAAGYATQIIDRTTLSLKAEQPMAWYEAALNMAQYRRILILTDDEPGPPPVADQWHIGTIQRAGWLMSDASYCRRHVIGLARALGSFAAAYKVLDQMGNASPSPAMHRSMHKLCRPNALYSPSILNDHLCIGIITYNRPAMLRNTITTLMESQSPHITYDLVISDDNSGPTTLDVLQWARDTYGANVLLNSNRGGVAEQSNRILRHFSGLPGLGVLSNDDLLFAAGWDEAYLTAYRRTPWSHFVFMDTRYEQRIHKELYPAHDLRIDNGVALVNWHSARLQGALVTFDQRSIECVGAFDSARFGLFSHEHVDWTLRHQRAQLAPGEGRLSSGCYDVLGADKYIALNMKDYKRSVTDAERDPENERRFRAVEKNTQRIYLPLEA